MDQLFREKIKEIFTEVQIRENEPLCNHTTFRIGGPADYFVMPKEVAQLQEVLLLCNKEKVPFYILGNGSNVLAGDQGFRGVIIQIGKAMSNLTVHKIAEETYRVTVGAGMLLGKFAREMANQNLTGVEFAGGIPGTVGGAIAMNAGAYGGEIKDVIQSATVVTQDGSVLELAKEKLELAYRSSIIQTKAYIVVEATFLLSVGSKEKIISRMEELNQKRREKQPLEYPSAGSTFKRPEGFFAGKLIEDAGLRGYRVGDMMVSEKHCGFVVNVGKGTAKDAHQLIEEVSHKVYEKFQIHLEPEVRFIGET